mmetsp:Transcript_44703/g.93592  ORF Transcript_44703/g.93592 Transcript_44703/m.93592 type:complete len:208 (+) Transcript_44703:1268-1891(+)
MAWTPSMCCPTALGASATSRLRMSSSSSRTSSDGSAGGEEPMRWTRVGRRRWRASATLGTTSTRESTQRTARSRQRSTVSEKSWRSGTWTTSQIFCKRGACALGSWASWCITANELRLVDASSEAKSPPCRESHSCRSCAPSVHIAGDALITRLRPDKNFGSNNPSLSSAVSIRRFEPSCFITSCLDRSPRSPIPHLFRFGDEDGFA